MSEQEMADYPPDEQHVAWTTRFRDEIASRRSMDAAVNDLLEAVRDYSDSDRITAAAARVRSLREGKKEQ